MNILVVCQYYKPEPFRVSDICESLTERGHTVTVVTGLPNYPAGELYPGYEDGKSRVETVNGARVYRCAIHPRKTGALHRFWNYYSFVFASKKCLARLNEDFDVVLVNQLSPVMMAEGALDWAKRHGKRCVLYCLDLWPESLILGGIRPGSTLYRAFWQISRRIYKRADEILITSRGFERYFRQTLQLPDKKITYLPQYAENQFDTVPPVQHHEPPYHFLFAGNIGEAQSVETIVEAARFLKDDGRICFHIVGDGIRLEACRQLAEGLSNITFYGRRDVSEMVDFYTMADAMLVTLKSGSAISDTLPGKVQTCLAAGRAIVGAADGETATVINEAACGLCVPAGDALGLAAKTQSMADEPKMFLSFGVNARAYYQKYFQKSEVLEKLEQILMRNCKILKGPTDSIITEMETANNDI